MTDLKPNFLCGVASCQLFGHNEEKSNLDNHLGHQWPWALLGSGLCLRLSGEQGQGASTVERGAIAGLCSCDLVASWVNQPSDSWHFFSVSHTGFWELPNRKASGGGNALVRDWDL